MSRTVYLKVKETIKNAVDLTKPVNDFTNKSTKAKIYDSVTNAKIGYIATTIQGIPVGCKDRIRNCESSIIFDDGSLNILIIHGSHGPFGNLVQPSLVVAYDYDKNPFEIHISYTKKIVTLQIVKVVV